MRDQLGVEENGD